MTLPTLCSCITVPNTYPDKVRAHIQYQLPEGTRYDEVEEYLNDLGFINVSRRRLLRNTIEGNQTGFLFDVTASYAPQVSRLHVYVDLNALRHIHADEDNLDGETALNWDTNWLPSEAVSEDNSWLLDVVDNLIWEAEDQITELVESFVRSLGHVPIGIYQGIYISKLEVAIDFGAYDPLGALERLVPNFCQQIRQLHTSGYRPTTNSYETLEDDSRMLHGYRLRHERYKAYVKTNKRIRLECEFQPEAFHRLGINRMISDVGNSFELVFEQVSSHCVEYFAHLIDGTQPNPGDNGSITDFLILVGQACRDGDRARLFVQALAHNGRVTSTFGYRYLRPFVEHGLIVRTCRGVYGPEIRWRAAVARMREQLGNLLGEVM